MPRVIAQSQFGDASIPMSDAVSLCGPAAAIAFASVNGRAPTLKEARDLARSVGWTPESGMAGPASEQALLAKMGVNADLVQTPDWSRVTSDVQSGRPAIVSTPRHYFTVSDYDPSTGKYFVGTSGTDLKSGGAEWMGAEDIAKVGGGVNGVLHLSKDGGGPSVATVVASTAPESAPTSSNTPVAKTGPSSAAIANMAKMGAEQSQAEAFTRKILGEVSQVPDIQVPQYTLPLPQMPGFRASKYVMPGLQ